MKRRISYFTLKEFIAEQMTPQYYDGFIICRLDQMKLSEIKLQEPMRTDCFGMSLILNGSLRLRIGFSEHEVTKDMIFFHSPTTIFEFLSFEEDLDMITFMFSLDFMKKIGMYFHGKSSLEYLFDNSQKVFSFSESLMQMMLVYLEHLKELNLDCSPRKNKLEIIRTTFNLINQEIDAALNERIQENNKISNRKQNLCIKFITLVVQNFQTHRNVQFYAEALFVSRKYLSRIVKEVSGFTPNQIIDQTVIAEASSLLRANDYSISEIMQQLNFSDPQTFTKFFKKNTGFSPLSYAQEYVPLIS